MIRLISLFSLSYWVQRPLKALLTLLGVATGLAVFTGIETANRSVLKGIESTIIQTSGASDLTIEGRSRPVSDEDFLIARQIPGTRVTPILELQVRCAGSTKGIDGGRAFVLLGIDPLSRSDFFLDEGTAEGAKAFLTMMSDPKAILLSRELALACGTDDGQALTVLVGGQEAIFWALLLPETGHSFHQGAFAFTDIATAQEISRRHGELSRLEVKSETDSKAWVEAHFKRFPDGLGFLEQPERLRYQKEILKAFQLNLKALSLVAVFVSGFIVFNAASLSLLYRRRELGILRSLGVTRSQLALLFLSEALILGILGSLLGWILGHYLAQAIMPSLLGTVRDLYVAQAEAQLTFDKATAITGLVLGIMVCLLGTLLPLIEASRIAPIEATRRLSFEKTFRHRPLLWIAGAGVGWGATLVLIKLSGLEHPQFSFAAAFCVLAGFLVLTPLVLSATVTLFRRLATKLRLASLHVAASQILENPYRYSVVTAAFSLGMALWIGIGVMIHSFRETVFDWLHVTIRGDIYLTLSENRRGQWPSFMPEDFLKTVQEFPGVERLDTFRAVPVFLDGDSIPLSAVALKDLFRHGQFQILEGSADSFFRDATSTKEVIPAAFAESLAKRRGLKAGDVTVADTPWGQWPLQVAAVLYDYTSDRGLIYIDREEFQRRSLDRKVNGIAVYLHDPSAAPEIARRIRALPSAPASLVTQLNRELKARVLNIFDETFRLTDALKYVALLVAFLGILTTLATLLEEKRREIGLLQVIGMLPGQLTAYGLSQGLLLAVAGFLLGALAGLALAWVLLKVVHSSHFGWTLFFFWDTGLLLLSLGLTCLAGALAAAWPIRLLRRIQASEALRYDE